MTVNGRPVGLVGVNRHDSHPDHGFAVTDDHRLADVQLISELGANFVRGSHYPQDEGFLDLVRRMWDRRMVRVHGLAAGRSAADRRGLAGGCGAQHPRDGGNGGKPSVGLFWGCCNEGDSRDPRCRPGYERLLRRLSELDPSRLVGYAAERAFTSEEVTADLAEMVAVNIYPGWYWGRIEDIPGGARRIGAAVGAAGLGDRPLLVTEVGAEAIPGWHDRAAERWSEEYQARLLGRVVSEAMKPERSIAGIALWVFADFRATDNDARILGRPRAYNNKGIFDEHRGAKLSGDVVRRCFSTEQQR